MAVLKGVAISECINGCASGQGSAGNGGQTWNNDPADATYGFYVDLGANLLVSPTGYEASDNTQLNVAYQGAARAEGILEAFGKAFKDYEPEWAYLITSPQVMASFRSANLVDETKVTDGNIDFDTIFSGKFRLISTRASQGLSSGDIDDLNGGPGGNLTANTLKTTFLVLPGAIALEKLSVPIPVEIYRNAASYKGSGTTEIWNRWGYIAHPTGYDWVGSAAKFASNANYYDTNYNGTVQNLDTTSNASATLANTTGVWNRKSASALTLGILPIFHA